MRNMPNHKIIEAAARAGTQPNTVRKYLQGGLSRSSVIERIELAFVGLDMGSYRRPQGDAPPGNRAVSSLPRNRS